jgi:hypothetical protein
MIPDTATTYITQCHSFLFFSIEYIARFVSAASVLQHSAASRGPNAIAVSVAVPAELSIVRIDCILMPEYEWATPPWSGTFNQNGQLFTLSASLG